MLIIKNKSAQTVSVTVTDRVVCHRTRWVFLSADSEFVCASLFRFQKNGQHLNTHFIMLVRLLLKYLSRLQFTTLYNLQQQSVSSISLLVQMHFLCFLKEIESWEVQDKTLNFFSSLPNKRQHFTSCFHPSRLEIQFHDHLAARALFNNSQL